MDAHKIYIIWIAHIRGGFYVAEDFHPVAATHARAAIKHARAWANAKYGPVSRKRDAQVGKRTFQVHNIIDRGGLS